MLSNLRRSRRGVATIIAEVMMVLIVILMSAIVYVWVVPAFTSQASKDNAGAAYAEKFETVRAQFANNAVSSPETVAACGSQDTSVGCAPSSYLTCGGSITSTYTGNVLVPANGVCLITFILDMRRVHNINVHRERPCSRQRRLPDYCCNGQRERVCIFWWQLDRDRRYD